MDAARDRGAPARPARPARLGAAASSCSSTSARACRRACRSAPIPRRRPATSCTARAASSSCPTSSLARRLRPRGRGRPRLPRPARRAAGAAGFERLVVLGVRLGADAAATKAELETLLAHHLHGRTGFALVPQGTPTNNTDGAPSGFSRADDPDASFDDPFGAPAGFDPSADWLARRDGQWLADWLGIDPAALAQVPGAHGTRPARGARDADGAVARDDRLHAGDAAAARCSTTGARLVIAVFCNALRQRPRARCPRCASAASRTGSCRRPRSPAWRLGGDEEPQPLDLLDALARRCSDRACRLGRARAGRGARAGVERADHRCCSTCSACIATSVEYHQRYAESLDDLYNRVNLAGSASDVRRLPGAAARTRLRCSCSRASARRRDRPRSSACSSSARAAPARRADRRPAAVGDGPARAGHGRRPQLHRLAAPTRRARRSRPSAASTASRRRPPARCSTCCCATR